MLEEVSKRPGVPPRRPLFHFRQANVSPAVRSDALAVLVRAGVDLDLVAVLDGEYDLGWSLNADGSFDLIADLWGVAKKHNQTELINSINQKYAVNKTLAEVKQRGLQNANVKLVVQK